MTTTTLPAPSQVAALAAAIHSRLTAWSGFERLRSSSWAYADCWASHTGYPLIAEWDEARDKGPLFDEAIRVLALKAAVWQLTHDDKLAELLVSPPVDEMVHAVLAQAPYVERLQAELGIHVVHMTDNEEFGYESGGYTFECYVAAFGQEPPERYWLGKAEVLRRQPILDKAYARAGIHEQGRRHGITFEAVA